MDKKQLNALIAQIGSPQEFEAALVALSTRAAQLRDGKPKMPPLSLAYWGNAHRQTRLTAKELEEQRAS